ncbi:lysine exporter LysO family protein [Thermococcus profundus]|uniref:lysine exporter LysO family protein n=1 Tax=Thermococcus profundus TaxID=49899 RepID=UPI001E40F570|nr:lysine exporter LysO family protein [Thermococcus profundus]
MSKFSILVFSALLLGIAVGFLFHPNIGRGYEIALYLLIFLIGVDIGGSVSEGTGRIPKKALMLPFSTLIGSIAGAALGAVVMGLSLKYSIAVGAGCGWYSLTGPVIARYSAFYGALGFLANILRELLTVVLYPLLIRHIPKEAAVSIGGATTMDTTLGLITKAGGRDVALTAFIHGFILTVLVPFILPIILGL